MNINRQDTLSMIKDSLQNQSNYQKLVQFFYKCMRYFGIQNENYIDQDKPDIEKLYKFSLVMRKEQEEMN